MRALRVQFGCRLPQLRRQKDLTQEQIAEAAGRCVDMLSKAAPKRGGHWYGTVDAVERYQCAVEQERG